MTQSLCLGLVHLAALLNAIIAALAQTPSPLRVAYYSSNRVPEYDCLSASQFVKLGRPTDGSNYLILCDSQDVRLSFSPLSDQTDCWHRCTIADIVDNETERWVNDIAQAVRRDIENRVSLLWPVRPVLIADDSKNDAIDDTSKAELVPICPAVPISFTTALPDGGLTDEDLRVYISLRPNPAAARGVTTVCRRDGFGRPAVAHINIHAPFAKAQFIRSQTDEGEPASLLLHMTLVHEMMHALALTSESLQQFRAPSRRLWGSVVEDADIRGIEAQFLVTPNAAFEVRQQYRMEPPFDRVDIATGSGGLEILGYRDPGPGTQQDIQITDGVHVSPQVARNDVSAPFFNEHSVLSNISLSILDDSGWYVTNRALAERLTWGLGQSDELLHAVTTSQAEATNLTVSAYNCEARLGEPKRLSCSYDPEFKGFCVSPETIGDLSSSAFSTYVDAVRQLGSCRTGAISPFFSGSRIIPEQIGESSMCFEIKGPSRVQVAVCLLFECVPNGVNVTVANQEYFCPFSNTTSFNVELSTSTQPYVITCPSMQAACPAQLPALQCPRNCNAPFGGECIKEGGSYSCKCNPGWSGEGCSVYECSGDVCTPAALNSDGPDTEDSEPSGMCFDGQCSCAEGFTGVDCRLPEPTCDRDCALLGPGYHCVGDVCERQCSTDGRSCVPVEELDDKLSDCREAFQFAKTTHVCVPSVNLASQLSELEDKLKREQTRWQPSNPSSPAAGSQECMLAQSIIACFSVFRECTYGTDVELPVCMESCNSFVRNCGDEVAKCKEPAFRDTRDSTLCSGSANPKDYLTRAQKFGIIFGAIIAFLLLLLLLLLWLYRCGPCSRQELPPVPPRMRELPDDDDVAEEAERSSAEMSTGLQMGAVEVQQPARFCGLSRRRWHANGRFAHPGAAAAAYAQNVSGMLPMSNGVAVPTPPLSHLDSATSAADTAEAGSFPSRYQSGGPDTPPVSSMTHSAGVALAQAVGAPPPGVALQPVSYGAHTTMQPQLQASAFSAADDPPLLQQSWQQDARRKGGNNAHPPPPPADGVRSRSSSEAPTPQRSRSPLSRHATNQASSPLASRLLSIEASANNSQITGSVEGHQGPTGDGPSGRRVHGLSSLSSRQLAALSGSVMLHGMPKSRAPGSHAIRVRRGVGTASSAAQQSSGTAPSAQNEADLDRIARMLSMGASSRARSSEPTNEGTGRRSPPAHTSMNLDADPASQPGAVLATALGTGPGALSHSSAHDASANESAISSSRRSGEASPLRTSTHGSTGMPMRSSSPTEVATSRYAGSQPRSGDARLGGPGSSVGPTAVGATPHAAIATHFGPESDLKLSHAVSPQQYQDSAISRAGAAASCSAAEARVMDHNAALGFFPPAEHAQDPFLDEPVDERAPSAARPFGLTYARTAHLGNAQGSISGRDATASITLQLPSVQGRTAQLGQPGSTSFRRGFASVGSLSLTGRHRSESTQTMPMERHASDPFLTDTINLDEDFRDARGQPESSKDGETHGFSPGGNTCASALTPALHRVSEISESHDTESLSVGRTGTVPVAKPQHSRSISAGSGASDPFLSESQM
eukprot:jgi/Ulvmu1/5622/UM023_0161.1